MYIYPRLPEHISDIHSRRAQGIYQAYKVATGKFLPAVGRAAAGAQQRRINSGDSGKFILFL